MAGKKGYKSWVSVADKQMEDTPQKINAIDFIEGPGGTGIVLRPVQRVLVKSLFAVPFDYRPAWADDIPEWGMVPMWDVYREKLIRTVTEEEYLHIVHEEGRALEVNEPIPTPSGFVKMGDIKANDFVFSADGAVTKVTDVQEPFLADVYRVSFDDGTSVLAHGNHLWETSAHTEKHRRYTDGAKNKPTLCRGASVKTTLEIKSSLKVGNEKSAISNHAVRLPAAVQLSDHQLPLDPYCLGIWLGDGHSRQAIITGEQADCLEILEHFSAAGFRWKQLPCRKWWWGVYGLLPTLRRMGLLQNKHIPHEYLWASSAQRLALLQGLLDSDGTCSKRGQVEFSNTNKNLSEGVYLLAASLGLKPGWKEPEPSVKSKRKQKQYRVRWTSPLPVFRMKRKRSRLSKDTSRSKRHYRYITAIESAGKAMVRCISIDHPSGLFLFGKNFNVTHNCNVKDWRDIPERGFNEGVVFCGRRGGKAFVINELVPTPNGLVENGDIRDGDMVLSPTGKPTRVVYAHEPFESEVYRVSFDDGTSVLAHGGHLWHTFTKDERKSLNRRRAPRELPKVPAGLCQCGCGKLAPTAKRSYGKLGIKKGQVLPCIRGHHNRLHLPQDYALPQGSVKTTEQILQTLRVVSNPKKPPQANHTIRLSEAVELPKKPLLLDPYCLGAWLGDGSKHGGSGFTGEEIDAFQILRHFTDAGFRWERALKYEYTWNINGLTTVLRQIGVLHNKHIPHDYLWASKEQRLALLQGLMDTDGSCMTDGQCEFSNTNKNLSEGVYHLAASLGLKPFWSEKVPVCTNAKGGRKRCKTAYMVKWTGNLPVFRLPRKLARLKKKCKTTQNWRYIVAVEPAGKRIVRCLTVEDPAGLFLFGRNFNVTHNSEVVAAIAAYKLYLTLLINSPQKFFGLAEGSQIDFTFLAQDETGAGRLFKKLAAAVNRASWFHTYLKDNNNKNLSFICEADRHLGAAVKPSIQVWSLPCLEEHELVWKANGLAEIGKEVQVGDVVLDAHGNRQYVIHKQYNEKEIWALETENFRNDPLLLTSNHTCIFVSSAQAKSTLPYLIERNGRLGAIDSRSKRRFAKKQNDIQWKEGPASDIAAGDYLLFPRIPENKRKVYLIDNAPARVQPYETSCFGHRYVRQESTARVVPAFQVSPLVCRLWGLYLAEGSIAKVDAGVNWDFHINEKSTLAKFVQETLISEFGLPSTIVDKEGNGCRVMCSSVQLARGFVRLFGSGCAEKTILGEALYWPSECQQALIQGWLSGDGCKDRPVGPTVSRKLAYSLFALGVQAGLLPAVKHKKAYTDKKGIAHRESWYVSFNKQERHYRFFQKIGDQEFYWSKVLRNASTGRTARVVDIGVENTESFLTKLAAVHNCTTNAVRGPSSVFLALDEFAHFRSEIGSTSEDMYVAATPAAGDFHHDEFDEEGNKTEIQDSLILSISSPLKKVGMMYDLYKMALEDGINEDNPTFALACSSAEMNPKLKAGFLKDKARKNPITFKAEYGGQFLESTETFVREIDVRSCVDVSAWDQTGLPAEGAMVRKNTVFFSPDQLGYNHFWGLDLGGVNVTDPENTNSDASALAIGHLEYRPDPNPSSGLRHGFHLVYDYIDRMIVGEQFEGPGIVIHTPEGIKYTDYRVLPLKDILIWLKEMNQALPCFRGATDQHAGRQLITLLEQNEIHNMELVNLTPAINSEMAYSLRGFINDKTANFPYVPKFIHEIKMVETDVVSKYRIRVHAPLEKGAHDDMVDAAMLVANLAETWLIEEGHLKLDPTGQSLIMQRQALLPSKPVLDLDSVSMSQMKTAERMYRMNKFPFGGGSHRVAKRGGRRF